MPTDGPTEETAVSPVREKNVFAERGIAWGTHVLGKMQLTPAAVAINLTGALLWRRLGAAIVDGVVLYAAFKFLNSLTFGDHNLTILLSSGSWIDTDFCIQMLNPIQPLLFIKPLLGIANSGIQFSSSALQWMYMSQFLAVAVIWLYHAVLESSRWQATLGKKICGVKVTDLNGRRITFQRATARHFAKCITFLPYFLTRCITDQTPMFGVGDSLVWPSLAGYVAGVASARLQCLHDAVADTLVQNAMPPEPAQIEAPQIAKAPERGSKTLATPVESLPSTIAVQEPESDTKECPFCAEPIKKKAIKCRYCGERLEQ